ncbi:MAG: DNA primase [Hyphomonadaceae bacterium]|nr:DNA primase [Hyphomonadaceae bacterium]
MRFSDAFLRTLRERVSIADYAGKRLVWDKRKSQPARGDYWACCPFHTEKSASFHVLDTKGVYKCFGCGEAGDIFTLAQKLEGGNFPETVERVAEFAGIPLPADDREDRETADRRKRLANAAARAGLFYAEALRGSEGAKARAYLEGREIGPDLWPRFGIGYAPAGWTGLIDRLTDKKKGGEFSLEELVEAGLARPGEDGKRAIDIFRERIIFEIADAAGRPMAFGGRSLDPNQPAKYINSPESALFHKGKTLYRLKQARELASRSRAGGLVVAEGYLDVIAFERAGIGAVAPMGTALTEDQLALVWRAGGEPILCFDGDAAGLRAADRALELALPHLGPEKTLRVAVLPAGEDPDDMFRRAGPEALKELLAAAQPASAALFERERTRRPLDTPEAKADFKRRLKEAANKIADPETKRLYLRELLAKADAAIGFQPRSEAPQAPFPGGFQGGGQGGGQGGRGPFRGKFGPPPGATAELKALAAGRRTLGPEELIRTAVDHPHLLETGAEALSVLDCDDPELMEIKTTLLDVWFGGETVDRAAMSLHLRRSGLARAASRLDAWPRPRVLKEELERDWTDQALAGTPVGAEPGQTQSGQTWARVAVRAGIKAKAARPRALNRGNEAEWAAQMGADLAAPAIREEARALRARVDEDPDAMARAQELLRDRLRAQGEALRISQNVGAEAPRDAETNES